jgi:tetratricopeptide (TPR) repeat protein
LSTKIEENDQISMCIQFLRDGNHEAVLEELDKYILEYPNDIRLLNDKGIILTKLGKYKEAKDSFDKALAINDEPNINENKATNSKNGIVWNNKGLTHCNNSEFKDAINCFDKAYEINGKTYTYALNNKGLAYYYIGKEEQHKEDKEKNYKEAIKCFDKVLELNPNNSNAFNNKGIALMELGWFEESKKSIDKAIELDTNNANAWNNRGRILAYSSNYQEAINYYNKVIEIKPKHREAWNNKGIALANLANLTDEEKYFSDAEVCYEKAIEIDNKFVHAINNKAMLYVSRHKYIKADEIIENSLGIDGKNQDTMDKKGIILFHLQKYDEALSWFKRATEKNPENKVSRYHMGNVYMQLKKYDEAIECFDDSLKDNLNFAEAHNAKASALFNKGNQKEASKEIKRAIEIKPSLSVANENIAKITSSSSEHLQNFWDFWKSSLFKKIVGITLVVLLLSTVSIITYHIIFNIILVTNSTNLMNSQEAQLMDISEGYFITLGIILFILLIPEIKKAKMGPMEFELEEQHIHPTNDSPSLSENPHFSLLKT